MSNNPAVEAIKIEHLVISGGGPSLFQTIGVLQQLEEQGKEAKYDITQLKTIYANSAGATVAVFYCIHRYMNYTWQEINDYLINRPWENVFTFDMTALFDAYTKRGIFDATTLLNSFQSFFNARNINPEITLGDFYTQVAPIDLHFFAFDVNAFQLDDISHLTHPTVRLCDALHMTCSIPILFTPCILGDACYIDGGIISNYPIKHCLAREQSPDTTLGINNVCDETAKTSRITSESTLIEFLISFVFKIYQQLRENNIPTIPHEIHCHVDYMSIDTVNGAIYNTAERAKLIEMGRATVAALVLHPAV